MKLLYIELYLYKPFLHHKTKHVTIDNLSHVTVISGENACGKSSLLRAISPYPSISTEFEKGGYKKLIYDHAGSIYEISSDFRKSTGAHSFIKDGVELNESGTTDVQNNLVMEHLHYDDVVEKLVTGKFKICDMSKVDRRVLFMETYPSSMGFILDYYKQVSSRLRAINNNIKMLMQRKISLEQQLVSPVILSDYKKERDDLVNAVSKLDLDIYTVNKAISAGKQALATIDQALLDTTPSYFQQKCYDIVEMYQQLVQEGVTHYDDCKVELTKLQSEIDHIADQIKSYEAEAKDINKELYEYKKYLSSDTETQIKECKNKIEIQNRIIKNTYLDSSIPDISEYELNKLESSYTPLMDTISYIIQQGIVPYWTDEEYYHTERMLNNYKMKLGSISQELNHLQDELVPVQNRLEKFKTRSWPKSCTMTCVLRDDYKTLIDSVQERYDEIQKRIRDLTEERAGYQVEYDNLSQGYDSHLPIRDILQKLNGYLTNTSYCGYVLKNKSFIDAMNEDATGVYNRITQVLEHARASKQVKDAKDTLVLLQAKLTSLESDSGQAKQLITDTVMKKEAKLNDMIDEIKTLREYKSYLWKEKEQVNTYQNLVNWIDELRKEYDAWKKVYFLKAEISYFSEFLDTIQISKNKINDKLRELDIIIKEQDNYLVRLNDEVNPELKKLKDLQAELAAVESQLSPTKGLSHVYIIRYINSVFRLANQFIARVWSYPMALELIDENDESFDYSFKLSINETSSIKDINIASAGQKSIINLCVMLAICIFRHYGNDYPIILDEVTVNMSLNHQNSLITFLNELFSDEGLKQIFIVDHCIDVCSSFASIAEMICLSRDFDIGQEWKRIGTIE